MKVEDAVKRYSHTMARADRHGDLYACTYCGVQSDSASSGRQECPARLRMVLDSTAVDLQHQRDANRSLKSRITRLEAERRQANADANRLKRFLVFKGGTPQPNGGVTDLAHAVDHAAEAVALMAAWVDPPDRPKNWWWRWAQTLDTRQRRILSFRATADGIARGHWYLVSVPPGDAVCVESDGRKNFPWRVGCALPYRGPWLEGEE